jgi:deoxyribodipyrimidine photo-lyase
MECEQWRATPIELKSASVELGRTDLEPIVDRGKGREHPFAAYARLRKR